MGGQKRYLLWGDTNILNSYRNQGINVDKITSISNEELTNIRTDDGVPKTDYYHEESKRVNMWKPLLSMVCNFIPGVNLLYGAASGLLGKDLITGQKLSGGNRLLSLFGSIGAAGASVAKATELGTQVNKITSQINRLNDLNKGIKTLGQIALLARNINNLSVALTANDLFDGSGQKIQGASRFMVGLQFASQNSPNLLKLEGIDPNQIGKLGYISNLTSGQLEYLNKVSTLQQNIAKITDYYQKGVMITGKEKIFSGKEVSDEQRMSLASNLLGAHIQQAASNPGTNIASAIKQGLASFVTDMVVNTPVNVIKDTTNLASNGIEMLVNGAIKGYSSILSTGSPNQSTIDKIVQGITLPVNLLNDAMQIYNNTAKYLTLEQVKNIMSRFISDSVEKLKLWGENIFDGPGKPVILTGKEKSDFTLTIGGKERTDLPYSAVNKEWDNLSDAEKTLLAIKQIEDMGYIKEAKELRKMVEEGKINNFNFPGQSPMRGFFSPLIPDRIFIEADYFVGPGNRAVMGGTLLHEYKHYQAFHEGKLFEYEANIPDKTLIDNFRIFYEERLKQEREKISLEINK